MVFKNLGRSSAEACDELAKNVMKSPRKVLANGAKVGIATVTKNPTAALSNIPDAITFYLTGNRFFWDFFDWLPGL